MADQAHGPDTDEEADPLVGRVLGEGYVLQERLGGGGFGAVYRAVDESGQVVAAKVLRVDRAALSADARTRFRREAQALVTLRHPRIVAIHAHGTSDEGLEYLVMDLLEGEDLADHLHRRRRVPVAEALALFDGMAEAVEYAHDQGFAHRDLKPANVFLRNDGDGGYEPIVLDFGLAKMVVGPEESLTATGMVLGTPQYMAPEQATGETVDRRADVYALGCILFEMLTGVPPFEGNTPTAILMKVLTTPPPPISPGLGVPAAVEEAIRRALAKNPEDRFEDIGSLRRALRSAAQSVPMTRMMPAVATEPPPATREARAVSSGLRSDARPRRWLWPAVGLVTLAGVGIVAAVALQGPGEVPVVATTPTAIALGDPEAAETAEGTEPLESAETTEAPPTEGEEARVGAPPTEVPVAPPEANPTMRPEPAQRRGRRAATAMSDSPPSMSTGPAATSAAATGPDYTADARRLRAKLDEIERTVAAVAATRRGLSGLAQGTKPTFCARGGGLPSGSEDSVVVSTVQAIRRVRASACEPFERAREPDAATLQKLRRIPATLDRAEAMANDRTISSNQPADVADQVAAAVVEARGLLRGVEDGNRPFPCDAPVFARLRRLERSPNSWSGAAAGRVTRLQRDICRVVGGVSGSEARALADRLTGQLDSAEGSIHSHETATRRTLRATEAMLR